VKFVVVVIDFSTMTTMIAEKSGKGAITARQSEAKPR
jgi:hypothetical protein